MRCASECEECGYRLASDAVWVQVHSEEDHQRRRTALYGAFRRLLDQEVGNRWLVAQAASQGLVGIRCSSGVYRGLFVWHTITREFWDELNEPGGWTREWLLRHLRETASDAAKEKYGVDVNPATWNQKVYDDPCVSGW